MAYSVETRLPPGLSIEKESLLTTLGRFRGPDQTVGDPAFDAAVYLHGPPVEAISRLDADNRHRLMAWLQRGLSVKFGRLVLEASPLPRSAEEVMAYLEALIAFAHFLERPESQPTNACS
jgi:hypothetical protein